MNKIKNLIYLILPLIIYYIYVRYMSVIETYYLTYTPLPAVTYNIVFYLLIGVILFLIANISLRKRKTYRLISLFHIIIAFFPLYASYLSPIPFLGDYMKVLSESMLLVELFGGACLINFVDSFR